MNKRTAVYAGTFDPLTYGHLDIIYRASLLFDNVIIAAAENPVKKSLFGIDERIQIINGSIADFKNCKAESFNGLLVDFAAEKNARVIIRGIRTFSDFEYEYQMALTNRKMAGLIETLFLMPSEKYAYISSSLVREIARYGGDVSQFIPPIANDAVIKKYKD